MRKSASLALSALFFVLWISPALAAGEGFLRCEDVLYASVHYTQCYWGVDVEYDPASERDAVNPTTYYWFRDGVYITDYTTGGSYHGQFGEGSADSCEGSPSGTFRYSLSTNSGSDDEFLTGILDCGAGVWTADAGTNSFYAESLAGPPSSATDTTAVAVDGLNQTMQGIGRVLTLFLLLSIFSAACLWGYRLFIGKEKS